MEKSTLQTVFKEIVNQMREDDFELPLNEEVIKQRVFRVEPTKIDIALSCLETCGVLRFSRVEGQDCIALTEKGRKVAAQLDALEEDYWSAFDSPEDHASDAPIHHASGPNDLTIAKIEIDSLNHRLAEAEAKTEEFAAKLHAAGQENAQLNEEVLHVTKQRDRFEKEVAALRKESRGTEVFSGSQIAKILKGTHLDGPTGEGAKECYEVRFLVGRKIAMIPFRFSNHDRAVVVQAFLDGQKAGAEDGREGLQEQLRELLGCEKADF